jgi:hypothetical protein
MLERKGEDDENESKEKIANRLQEMSDVCGLGHGQRAL